MSLFSVFSRSCTLRLCSNSFRLFLNISGAACDQHSAAALSAQTHYRATMISQQSQQLTLCTRVVHCELLFYFICVTVCQTDSSLEIIIICISIVMFHLMFTPTLDGVN